MTGPYRTSPYRTWSEDALIVSLRTRLDDCDANRFGRASRAAIDDVERRLGFSLPRMLVRVWTEVQNGGFGPGNGIGGIPPNGYVDEDLGADCIEHYLANVDEPLSMSKSLMICSWGCAMWSLVDCNDPAGRILTDEVLRNEKGQMSIRYYEVCPSLQEWLAKWVSDVSLWDEMHDVVGEVTRYNPFKRQLETRPDKRLKGPIVYQSPFL